MKKVVVLGYAPLPLEPSKRSYSGNFRTWNTIQYLLEKGHSVTAIGMRLTGSFPDDYPEEKYYKQDNLCYYSVDELSLFHNLHYLRDRLTSAQPDCIIGINSFPACQAARLNYSQPLWADLNGYVMSEAQSKAHRFNDNNWLNHFWAMEKPVLYRADKFSTASERQKYALIGELATIGRLNNKTYNYELVHSLPNCLDPSLISSPETPHNSRDSDNKSEKKISILWAGTMNTWVDVKTLAKGIYLASREIPSIELIVTGGTVKGHDEKTARLFQEEIKKYDLEQHIKYTGWVELNEINRYLNTCDCGLCIDDFCWESLIGARYRITNMLGFGLPVICSRNTEISLIVEEEHLGLAIQPHSPEELKNALLDIASHPELWKNRRKEIKKKALDLFHYQNVLQPLGEWVDNPRFAPDREGFRFPSCSEEDLMHIPASRLCNILSKKIQVRFKKIFGAAKKPPPPL